MGEGILPRHCVLLPIQEGQEPCSPQVKPKFIDSAENLLTVLPSQTHLPCSPPQRATLQGPTPCPCSPSKEYLSPSLPLRLASPPPEMSFSH